MINYNFSSRKTWLGIYPRIRPGVPILKFCRPRRSRQEILFYFKVFALVLFALATLRGSGIKSVMPR